MLQFPEGAFAALELLQELARHVVLDLSAVLDHADAGAVLEQLGDHEMRLLLPVEQIVVGIERLQSGPDLGAELSGLAGQDHIHGKSLAVGSVTARLSRLAL